MSEDNLTVRILEEIRDNGRQMADRIDQTNQRLDQTSQQLTETQIRLSTAITDMHGTMSDIKDLLAANLRVRDRVQRCENDIDSIKKHIGL